MTLEDEISKAKAALAGERGDAAVQRLIDVLDRLEREPATSSRDDLVKFRADAAKAASWLREIHAEGALAVAQTMEERRPGAFSRLVREIVEAEEHHSPERDGDSTV